MRLIGVMAVLCLVVVRVALAEDSALEDAAIVTGLRVTDITEWEKFRTSGAPEFATRRILFEQRHVHPVSAWAALTAHAIRLRTPLASVVVTMDLPASKTHWAITAGNISELWKEELKANTNIEPQNLLKDNDLRTLFCDLRYRASALALVGGPQKCDEETARQRSAAAIKARGLAEYAESLAQGYYKNARKLEAAQLQILAVDFYLINWCSIENAKALANPSAIPPRPRGIREILDKETWERFIEYLRAATGESAKSIRGLEMIRELEGEYASAASRLDRDSAYAIDADGVVSATMRGHRRADVTLLDSMVAASMGMSPEKMLQRVEPRGFFQGKYPLAPILSAARGSLAQWRKEADGNMSDLAKRVKFVRQQDLEFKDDAQKQFEQLADDIVNSATRERKYPKVPTS